MPIQSLTYDQLRRTCSQNHYLFETTAELDAKGSIIGQPRGTRAIEFGIDIQSHGYNIYVLGEIGTGRITAIHQFLQEKAIDRPTPPGWLYVHNFTTPYQPRSIRFSPEDGVTFKQQMEELLRYLQEDLPKAFNADAYQEEISKLQQAFELQQDKLFQVLQQEASNKGFALLRTASGLNLAPIADGKVIKPEEIQQMPAEERQEIDKIGRELTLRLEDAFIEVRQKELEVRRSLEKLNQDVAERTIKHHFERLHKQYAQYDEVQIYLKEVFEDVLKNLELFLPDEEEKEKEEVPDFRHYGVNILVDNSKIKGAPVVVEPNPTYANLIGRIEYEMHYGGMVTHFTNIKAGSLHRANGGYLVINARDLLQHPFAWEALKRAIKQREICLQSTNTFDGGHQVLAKSLDPEPIPLDVKIVLMGSPRLYYMLYELEEDFRELFKVKADFDTLMSRNHENENEYAYFIASRCHEENLLHFDRSAVAKVVEFGSRLGEHQNKLSTRFGIVADVVRESSYWAGQRKATLVTGQDVRKAIDEHNYRASRAEEYSMEMYEDDIMLVSTDGYVVGQVNGLSVIDMGDYAFGQPSRITVRTYMGESGVVNIDREVNMTGPLHNKGLMTLIGYFGGQYATDQPLSFSASISFEQNYGGIEGDSASSAELYALLSSLSGKPIHQGRAVTGSVSQNGEIQPIGGATEKIEGFFKLCQQRGLTGDQGVLIPAGNIQHLMLDEDVIEAVKAGQFHIWAVKTIDEGIELLTDVPAGEENGKGVYPEGTIHALVKQSLLKLAEDLKSFGRDDDEEE